MLSFLNIIDLETGRQIRAAELGFEAREPSFVDGGIAFLRDGEPVKLDLTSGEIAPIVSLPEPVETDAQLEFLSPEENNVAYVALVVRGVTVARFMGNSGSLGARPLSPDGTKIVFIGLPSQRGFG